MTHRGDRGDDRPAGLLGDVWDALDVLPKAAAPASMTATTIEMAAIGSRVRVAAAPRSPWWWFLAAVVVAGCFAIGLVAGRLTLPRLEPRLPARLPPREAIRGIIEEEMARQRLEQPERQRDRRRPRPPAETPEPPR